MNAMRTFKGRNSERGVTLVEQVMAALFIGFLILVWVNSVRVTTKGTVQSKNSLRAQNLALSKLEDVKALADKASYASTWSTLTQTALVKAYRTPTVVKIENRSFTWVVNTDFAYLPVTITGSPTGAVTYTAVVTATATANILLRARISWGDVTGPKVLTMTGYATDYRQ